MNKIQELAYRNVKKYKKHYLFVSILIFCVSIFFLSYTIIFNNHYEVKKMYNQDIYGTWYYKATLVDMDEKELIEREAKTFHESYRYSFVYDQDVDSHGYRVGYAEEDMFDFANLELVEGQYPVNEYDIMVSTKVVEEKKYKLNDMISLDINNNTSEYKIVGIIKNSQDNIFPDIYTNIKKGIKIDVYTNQELDRNFNQYKPRNPELHALVENVVFNEYGYIGTPALAKVALNNAETIVLFEGLIIVVICIIVLSMTSLKRRMKEFALLRGIGMTSKQLFSMIIYEMIYTLTISLLIAFILSFPISYLASKILDMKYGYYIYNLNLSQIFIYTGFLFTSILISMIYPITLSCKTALSGSFEGVKFKKIQVRYRILKYQNKYRLALRDLNVQKGMTISIIFLFCLSSILYLTNSVDKETIKNSYKVNNDFGTFHYYEMTPGNPNKDYYTLFSNYIKETDYKCKLFISKYVCEYKDGDEHLQTGDYVLANDVMILDQDIIENCTITGRLPENDKEIVVGRDTWMHTVEIGDNYFGLIQSDNLNINSGFSYNGENYEVVGIIENNAVIYVEGYWKEFGYAIDDMIYVSEKTYNDWNQAFDEEYKLRVYFDDIEQSDDIKNELMLLSIDQDDGIYSPTEDLFDLLEDDKESNALLMMDMRILLLPIMLCFVLAYYLNKSHIMNNSHDIALSKLIGMTNQDILTKQLYKALIMSGIVIAFELFWILMLNLYYKVLFIPALEFILSSIVVLGITVSIYCLPLREVLNNNVFDLIKGDE